MRLILPILVLVALLIASVAWDAPPDRADLTVGYTSIETLDAQVARASEDIRVAYALFEGLCTFDSDDFTIQPGVAESWDVSEDGTTYTFHLRPDVRWSDGSPVTAHDFRFAWKLGLMPDTAPPYIAFLFFIRGGEDYFNWCVDSLERVREMDAPPEQKYQAALDRIEQADEKFDELVGVEVLDDRTLVVQLERRLPYFLEIAATWPLFPLHPPTLRANMRVDPHSYRLRRDPQWTKPDAIVSNGPYTLERWDFKRRIRLEANPYYWNAEEVGPESVELINFQDLNTMFTAYESGTLDLMLGAGPLNFAADLVRARLDGSRDDVHGFDAYGTYYYVFNTRPTRPDGSPNPLADPRVRKALAMSIDKQPLVEQVTRLRQTTTSVMVPEGAIKGYESPDGLPYDPERARRLMAEAGYPGGEGFPPLVLLYNNDGGHKNVAQAIAKMWNRELGIDINLQEQEFKVFLRRTNEGDFDVARAGWFGDYLDPTTFLDLFKTGNGNNDAGFSDPRYDALLAEAAAESDPQKRMDLLRKAETYVMEEGVPAMPLYHYKMIHLYDADKISGVSLHPRNLQMFHRMKLAEND